MLDIFNEPAFNVSSLTLAINRLKIVPSLLGKMRIFKQENVATLSILIENQNGKLKLVAPSPRGGPGDTIAKDRRAMRSLVIPHFQRDDAIYADEVQGLRAFGSETQLETVMGRVAARMQRHSQDLDFTEEYSRVGAVKGIVTYADGTTLDLFAELGVTAPQVVFFDLGSSNAAGGTLRELIAKNIIRPMADRLEGVPFSGVAAICGNDFFDKLIKNKEVRETYLNQQRANELREGYLSITNDSYGVFDFGGVRWINYRGQVGGTPFVAADKAHFFPMNAPDVFVSTYGPADYIETVNTIGKKRYAKLFRMQNDKGMNMEVQSNVVHFCARPEALITGDADAS